MYKNFFSSFGLRENPFSVNPDPRFLIPTRQIRDSLDDLTLGIQARNGLMLLTGEAGTGKTTIVNQLLDWLHERGVTTAFIFNPHLEVNELFDFMLADFGIPSGSQQASAPLMRLNRWLLERNRAGECPTLIVDEAQGLPMHALEEIRMLVNLETPHQKLMQVVLSGQPELEAKLNQPELRQLRQRIALRCKTSPLNLEEAHNYVRTRLSLAGAKASPSFTSEAMDAVHLYSGGIPRVMNLLCEHALITALLAQVEQVPAHMVEQVASKYQFDSIKPVSPSRISIGATSDHVIPMESILDQMPISTSALLDSASISKPNPSHELPSSGSVDEVSAPLPRQIATSSDSRREGASEISRISNTPIMMRTPIPRRTKFDSAGKTDRPCLNPFDSTNLGHLIAELELDSRPPTVSSTAQTHELPRRTYLYKLGGARWSHLQTIRCSLRESLRRWFGWRDVLRPIVVIPAWEKMRPFLELRLRYPIRWTQRSRPKPQAQNLARRAAGTSISPARALDNRSWFNRRNGRLPASLSLAFQHMNALFRWLQQPMRSVHHRHGSGTL